MFIARAALSPQPCGCPRAGVAGRLAAGEQRGNHGFDSNRADVPAIRLKELVGRLWSRDDFIGGEIRDRRTDCAQAFIWNTKTDPGREPPESTEENQDEKL